MAVKTQYLYANDAERLYDIALSTGLFEDDMFEEYGNDYVNVLASSTQLPENNFKISEYNRFTDPQDKMNYMLNEYYGKTGSEEYVKARNYFDSKLTQIKLDENFNKLSEFEKWVNTGVGVVGSALNDALLGTIDGIYSTVRLVTGDTTFANEDPVKYAEATRQINDFINRNTYINRNNVVRIGNDVVNGIARMWPMFVAGALAPVTGGTSLIPTLIGGAGQLTYFAGMAGNVAEETIKSNPELNYWNLLGYTAASTAVEFLTEKLVGDVVFGKGLINPQTATRGIKNSFIKAVAYTGLTSLGEGVEEMSAEIADGILKRLLIDGNAKMATMEEVLYAGLIGGLIGSITTGGTLATKTRISGLDAVQSLVFRQNLGDMVKLNENTNNVQKLMSKYGNINNVEELSKLHPEEYAKAKFKDDSSKEKLTKIAGELSDVMSAIGIEGFNKATTLIEDQLAFRDKKLQSFLNAQKTNMTVPSNVKEAIKSFNTRYPNQSVDIRPDLNSAQRELKDFIKKTYGKDLYYVDFGSKVIDSDTIYNAFVFDSQNIFLSNEIFDRMSRESILNTVVKEELLHTAQRALGKDVVEVSLSLQKAFDATGARRAPVKLDGSYSNMDPMGRNLELQAKGMLGAILFDEMTVDRVFKTNKNVFIKVFKFISNALSVTKPTSEAGKVRFKTLVEVRNRYLDLAANNIGNTQDANELSEKLGGDAFVKERLNANFSSNITTEHFIRVRDNYSKNQENMMNAMKFIESKMNIAKSDDFNFENVGNPEMYGEAFKTEIQKKYNGINFLKNLNYELVERFNVIYSAVNNTLLHVEDINNHSNLMVDYVAEQINMFDTKEYQFTLDQFYDKSFVSRFDKINELTGKNENPFIGFPVTIKVSEDNTSSGVFDGESIILNVPKIQNTASRLAYTLYHETSHLLASIQGLQKGTSSEKIKSILVNTNKKDILTLFRNLTRYSEEELSRYASEVDMLEMNKMLDILSYGIYMLVDGEIDASSTRLFNENVSVAELKIGSSGFASGFLIKDAKLVGYGRFASIKFPAEVQYTLPYSANPKATKILKDRYLVTSWSKTSKNIAEEVYGTYIINTPKEKQSFENFREYLNNIYENTMKRYAEFGDNENLQKLVNRLDAILKQAKSFFTPKVTTSTEMTVPNIYENFLKSKFEKSPKGFVEYFDTIADALKVNVEELMTYVSANNFGASEKAPIVKERETIAPAKKEVTIDKIYEKYIKLAEPDQRNLSAFRQFMIANYSGNKNMLDKTDKFIAKRTAALVKPQAKVSSKATTSIEASGTGVENVASVKEGEVLSQKDILEDIEDLAVRKYKNEMLGAKTKESKVAIYKQILADKETDPQSPLYTQAAQGILFESDTSLGKFFRHMKTLDERFKNPKTNRLEKLSYLKNRREFFSEDRFETTEEGGRKLIKVFEDPLVVKVFPSREDFLKYINNEIAKLESEGYKPPVVVKKQKGKLVSTPEANSSIVTGLFDSTDVDRKRVLNKGAAAGYEGQTHEQFIVDDINRAKSQYYDMIDDSNVKEIITEMADTKGEDDFKNEMYFQTVHTLREMYAFKFSSENLTWLKAKSGSLASRSGRILNAIKDTFGESHPVTNLINEMKKELGTDIKIPEGFVAENTMNQDTDALLVHANDVAEKLSVETESETIKELETELRKTNRKLTAIKNHDDVSLLDIDLQERAEKGDYEGVLKLQEKIAKMLVEIQLIQEQLKMSEKKKTESPEDVKVDIFSAENREKVNDIIKKLNGFRYFSMLSSPITLMRNEVGNQGLKLLNHITGLVEGFIGTKTSKQKGQFVYDNGKPIDKTVDDFVEKTYIGMKKVDTLLEGGKYQYSEANRIKQLKAKELNKLFPNIPWLQTYVDFIYDRLDSGDTKFQRTKFINDFKKLLSSNLDTIHKRLVDVYTKAGEIDGVRISLEEAIARLEKGTNTRKEQLINALKWKPGNTEHVKDLLASMDSATLELLEKQAVALAAEQYLRSESAFSDLIADVTKKHPVVGLLLAPIVPFPKVAYNIARLAYKYSPANVISVVNQGLKNRNMFSDAYAGYVDPFAQATFNKELARTGIGFVSYGIGALLAALGMIDIDDDEIDGVVITAGDFKIRMSDLAPGFTGLAVGAAILKGSKNGIFDGSGIEAGLSAVYDATLLGNIDYMFKYNRGVTDISSTMISNYFGQYVPSALKFVNKFGAKKQLSNTYFGKVFSNVLSGIPIASAILPNKVDPYTGKTKSKVENIWDVIFSVSPVKARFDDFGGARGIAEDIGAPTDGLQGLFTINGTDIRLNNRERETYARVRGKVVNKLITEFASNSKKYEVVTEGTAVTKAYNEMSQEERKKILTRIYEQATEYAKIKYWTDNGNYYVFTTYEKMADYKNAVGDISNVRLIPRISGSKYIRKE